MLVRSGRTKNLRRVGCGRVTDSELVRQRQGRTSRLDLAEQEDREKPRGHWQLRCLHHRASRQRGLVAAGLALKAFRPVILNHAVRRAVTTRAAKAVRPAGLLQRCCALLIGAELGGAFRHRHPRLKLNPILGHSAVLRSGCRSNLRPVVAHIVNLRRIRANPPPIPDPYRGQAFAENPCVEPGPWSLWVTLFAND